MNKNCLTTPIDYDMILPDKRTAVILYQNEAVKGLEHLNRSSLVNPQTASLLEKSMKIKRICKKCKKEFYVMPYIIKNGKGKFCSNSCFSYWKSLNGRIKRICKFCEKEFEVNYFKIKTGNGKYCSKECYYKSEKVSKITRKCMVCGKIFYVYYSSPAAGKYCSRKCWGISISVFEKRESNRNWKGGFRVKTKCAECGKEFLSRKRNVRKSISGNVFCSKHCSGLFNIRGSKKLKNTDIEEMINKELLETNIFYGRQFKIKGIAIVDFILEGGIIIQCDGDYWHSKKEQRNKDINQDVVLGFMGYKIYRLKGKDILKNPHSALVGVLRKENYDIKKTFCHRNCNSLRM